MGINEHYSSNPIYDKFYVITGSVTPVSFPSGTAKLFRLKADTGNGVPFMIGNYIDNLGKYPIYPAEDIGWNAAPASRQMAEMVHSSISGAVSFLYLWMKD